MKRLHASLEVVLLGLPTAPCSPPTIRGGASSHAARGSVLSDQTGPGNAKSITGYLEGDDDGDMSTYDDRFIRLYGRAAGTLDRQAIVGLVRRYFAVALAGDGVVACSMLSSKLAKQADLAAAVPRDYVSPDVSALRGKPCSQFMSLLFGQAHEQLAYADVASLEVTVVRVQGDRGLAVLAFRTASERYIPLQREHGTWKIDAPLDGEIP
jgi:hypothetical protein